jgi:hypothetical protein
MILFVLFALAAAPALALGQSPPDQPYPYDVQFEATCEGDALTIRLIITDLYGEGLTVDVRRIESTPNMGGEVLLVSGLSLPADQAVTELLVPDPGIQPGGAGLYEVVLMTSYGYNIPAYYDHLSCTEVPVMVGHMWTDGEFEPCDTESLYMCDQVDLAFAEDTQYIGSWQVLEVYGFPQAFNARDDCRIQVMDIVPREETACPGPVPVNAATWGALKSTYR